MANERVKDAWEKFGQLETERDMWEQHWEDITDYALPAYGRYTTDEPNKGEKRNEKIFDHTPTFAVRILAAGMMGGMSSPSRPWFKLTLSDRAIADHPVIKRWLNDTEKILALALAQSGFYQSAHQMYTELGGFGTGLVFIEQGENHPFRFVNSTVGEYYLAANKHGEVDTVFRDLRIMAKNVVKMFGEGKCSEAVIDMAKDQPFEFVDILHCVRPNKTRDKKKLDSGNKPIESLWFEKGFEQKELLLSGYDRMPCVVPRWNVTGADVYGRSPMMDILPTVKTLHDKAKTAIANEHLTARPPLNVPEEMRGRVNLLPGGLNYNSNPQSVVTPILRVQPDMQGTMISINDLRSQVSRGLYNDLFMMITEQDQRMTATEVMERREEKMTMLGPVTERLQSEYFDPLITRCIDLLAKRGALPMLPPDMAEAVANYEVEYVSMIAQAQKLAGTRAILQFSQYVGQLGSVQPDALDKFDADQAIDEYGDMLGVPVSIIRTDEDVEVLRENRAKEMAEQKKMQMEMMNQQMQGESAKGLNQAAGAVKQISEAAGAAGAEMRERGVR